MNENFITNKRWFFNLWLKRSKSLGAQAWRELESDGLFKPFYFYYYGYRKEVFAFDLENGIFFHCQDKGTTQNDRLVTIVEYELYGVCYINNTLKYSMILDWKFYLKCLPLLSIRMDNSLYNLNHRFFSTLHAKNQGVVDALRKPSYPQWREKMKQKEWHGATARGGAGAGSSLWKNWKERATCKVGDIPLPLSLTRCSRSFGCGERWRFNGNKKVIDDQNSGRMLKNFKSIGFFEADRAMYDQPDKDKKREYRKGHPLPQTEHNRRLREKLILSHKLFKAYVPREIADEFKAICYKKGETMQDMVSMLIAEFNEKNKNE